MMVVVAVVKAPRSSVTVKLTLYVPCLVKVWLGFWTVALEPSPKFQAYEMIVPSASEAVPVNRTVSGAEPTPGEAWMEALGGEFTVLTLLSTERAPP